MLHKMKLYDASYELIKKGIKTMELRLNDDKRKKIKVGDTLLFINTKTEKWLAVKVKRLYFYPTFKSLFEHVRNKKTMGFLNEAKSIDEMVLSMRKYYSEAMEKEYGVVGIEMESPKVEMDFPVQCDEAVLKHVFVAAFYDGKLVFCRHQEQETFDLPGGPIDPEETPLFAAKRELFEKTNITDIRSVVPIAAYHAQDLNKESNGAYGMLYAAEVEKMPQTIPGFEESKTVLYDIAPKEEGFSLQNPPLPEKLTHFEIDTVLLYYIQRMLANDDIDFYEEEMDYYMRLKYYEEAICVDYNHFDADAYLHYVMMRRDCEDSCSALEKVVATEENYQEIRNALLWDCDSFEFFRLLVQKFGAEKVWNDTELMEKMYSSFYKEDVEATLGIETA